MIEVARKVFQETGDDQLQDAIEKCDSDSDVLRITDVTRCHLAEALNTFELAGRQDLVELLRKHWPSIDSTRSSQDLDAMLIDDIYQHAVRNNDWDNAEVLKQVGWLTCSQTRLFEVLEDVLHPIRRDTAEQGQMVTKLNPILSRDGYLLVPGQPISGHRTYVVQQVAATGVHPADAIISETMMLFDENAVQHAWKKALDRRGTDPEGAVTPPGPCWRQFASTS